MSVILPVHFCGDEIQHEAIVVVMLNKKLRVCKRLNVSDIKQTGVSKVQENLKSILNVLFSICMIIITSDAECNQQSNK